MRFEEHMRMVIGTNTFDEIRKRKPRARQTALKVFEEHIKRTFDPDDATAEYSVPFNVNDGEAPGIIEGYVDMSCAQVWAIFEPVINSIVRLIESQIHRVEARGKSVNGIILVGGFGQSNSLFKKLQAKFGYLSEPPPHWTTPTATTPDGEGFQVMQPNNAWTAVVRGGVLGLEGTGVVLSRVSRRH